MARRRRSIANLTDFPIQPREWRDPEIERIWERIDERANQDRNDPRKNGSVLDAVRDAQRAGEVP